MSSSILTPLADALIEKGEALDITGYRWAPKEISMPCLVVELPEIERTGVDEPEDHLGQNDWTVTFNAIFYFDLATAQADQDKAVDLVEAFIVAIDEDQGLGGLCQEAKVITAFEPEFPNDDARAAIRWPTRVQILKFV